MTNGYYSKYATLAAVGSVLLHAGVVPVAAAQITEDRSLVPPVIRDASLQEISGELALQHVQLLAANRMRPMSESIHERHKAAQTKISGAFNRATEAVASVLDLADTPAVRGLVQTLSSSLSGVRDLQSQKLAAIHEVRCRELRVQPQRVTLTEREREYGSMVPRLKFRFYSEEYRAASGNVDQYVPANLRMRELAATEVPWSIDGVRSILDIYNLVRAEYGNVTTNSTEWKFAYVVTPETADIDIEAVAAVIRAMEQAGLVEISRR